MGLRPIMGLSERGACVHFSLCDRGEILMTYPNHRTDTIPKDIQCKSKHNDRLRNSEVFLKAHQARCVNSRAHVYGQCQEAEVKGDKGLLARGPVARVLLCVRSCSACNHAVTDVFITFQKLNKLVRILLLLIRRVV